MMNHHSSGVDNTGAHPEKFKSRAYADRGIVFFCLFASTERRGLTA
jgi:hypothetical protein